jgi:hypothetical protein
VAGRLELGELDFELLDEGAVDRAPNAAVQGLQEQFLLRRAELRPAPEWRCSDGRPTIDREV